MIAYWWIPIVLALYVVMGILSIKVNRGGGLGLFIGLYIVSSIAIWPFVVKYSRNLILDGTIYDFMIILGYFGAFYFMGEMDKLVWYQWCGLGMVITGLWLLK